MSCETFEYHHDLHHKAYVDNSNRLISGTEWDKKSLEEIITGTYDSSVAIQSSIFNNVSQLWNHNQFWEMMGPSGNLIPPELELRIKDAFGSVARLRADFIANGIAQFGSGWCWLVVDDNEELKLVRTENGVNPLCFGQIALLGCDLWEHSYYIDFRNKRPEYIGNFFDNLVNWDNVAKRLSSS